MDKESKNSNDENIEVENSEINLSDGLNNEVEIGGIVENTQIESDTTEVEPINISKIEYNINNNQEDIKFSSNKKYQMIIIFTIAIILLVGIHIEKIVSKYENKTFPGTSIYNTDISNLNKDEFLNKVNKIETNIAANKLKICIDNKIYDISFKNLILKYDNEKLYEDIMKKQNKKNKFLKFISIVRKENTNYNLYVEIDKNKFNDLKDKIAKNINIKCIEPKVIIDDGKISYKEGKNGYKLDENTLYSDIKTNLDEKNLIEENITVDVKMVKDRPKIYISDLKNVNYKVSTYTTIYQSGNSRGSNIENAANKIDDFILMPGDEFSYEKIVGPIIESNGYKYAPVISNGKLVDGIGGGVCQVSSTLYNTQLKAGILPTERRNHSKPVNYVPRGLDATLASGSIDYKFKNIYEYPLVINTIAENGRLTIEIWSNENVLKSIEYKPVSYINGNIADTYLYGYDKDGKKVYEKHIDTSVYR